jgi:hypothetical protein
MGETVAPEVFRVKLFFRESRKGGQYMANEKFCTCGSVADWAEVGSTWICVACRGKEVNQNIDELKEALGRLERAEKALRSLKVDTASIAELLGKLQAQINNIIV